MAAWYFFLIFFYKLYSGIGAHGYQITQHHNLQCTGAPGGANGFTLLCRFHTSEGCCASLHGSVHLVPTQLGGQAERVLGILLLIRLPLCNVPRHRLFASISIPRNHFLNVQQALKGHYSWTRLGLSAPVSVQPAASASAILPHPPSRRRPTSQLQGSPSKSLRCGHRQHEL